LLIFENFVEKKTLLVKQARPEKVQKDNT